MFFVLLVFCRFLPSFCRNLDGRIFPYLDHFHSVVTQLQHDVLEKKLTDPRLNVIIYLFQKIVIKKPVQLCRVHD
jgi:hypothetical protein